MRRLRGMGSCSLLSDETISPADRVKVVLGWTASSRSVRRAGLILRAGGMGEDDGSLRMAVLLLALPRSSVRNAGMLLYRSSRSLAKARMMAASA